MLEYDLDIPNDINVGLSKDYVNVIFDNLVLNTLQQNKDKQRVGVSICATSDRRSEVSFIYQDDGVGFKNAPLFMEDPMSILEPFETSRTDGHGLGMYIVSRAISSSDGTINRIDGKNGFRFEFSLRGEKE